MTTVRHSSRSIATHARVVGPSLLHANAYLATAGKHAKSLTISTEAERPTVIAHRITPFSVP